MTAIAPSDIQFFLSAPAATAGNATAGSTGNTSGSGGWLSTTQLTTGLDNLFTDLTGTQNANSQVDYICLFVLNNTASTNSMLNTVVWIPTSSDTTTATSHAFAIDPTGVSVKAATSQQAVKTTSATGAPSGITTWTAPSSSNSGGVSLGANVAPGSCFAIWFRRTARNSAPLNSDGFTVEIDFDTQG